METLGCEREYSDFDLSAQIEWCNVHQEPSGDFVEWTDRGCPVAVAAADAALGADRPSIQAQALREAAETDAINIFDVFRYVVSAVCVEDLLARADRLEPQP
jgi:hypothetical protein